MKQQMIITGLIVVAVLVLMLAILPRGNDSSNQENFVAYNNPEVRWGRPQGLLKNDEIVKIRFNEIIAEDSNKFHGQEFTGYKETTWFEEDLKGLIDYVLRRINLKANRRFVALDLQSARKERTLDPNDRRVVNRWTVNLFITEKNKTNVHGWAMNISFTCVQKGELVKIEKLHTITDHFFDKPEIDGVNVHDKYYKLLNPFHLQSPWTTSGRVNGREVLMPEEKTEALLAQWHTDLKTPQYRCFKGDNSTQARTSSKDVGERTKERDECVESLGTWDKPVENDAECPFYRANKNFPNRLGGVKLDENRCEMPINTKTVGYRYISTDPIHKPWCYNCKEGVDGPGSWGPCCDEQLDPDLYPNLGGNPDYAFPGDELERYQNREVLAQRGLSWQKYPTRIRDITNPNQRQPVFNAIVGHGPGKINLP